jgi:SAM-dependent methyltransferase
MLRAAYKLIRRWATRTRRRFGWIGGSWAEGLPEESNFWRFALTNPSRYWSAEAFRFRMDSNAPLQPELCALFANHVGTFRILDVGAGPLTSLGKRWLGHDVEITPIDPLAPEYDALLADLNLVAPVRTKAGTAEKLDEAFAPNQFDLAYASNALDHAHDPVASIAQMLRVVKPGGCVYLWHFANEGLTESYAGLHQWDFDVRDGDFLISNGRRKCSLQERFGSEAVVTTEQTRAYGKRVVIGILRKRGAG